MLSLYQPYASGIALGLKVHETRSWKTDYRGLLGIHATARFPLDCRGFASTEYTLGRIPKRLPLGAILCVVRLVEIVPTMEAVLYVNPIDKLYGDYADGRYAWKLEVVKVFDEPIPHRGRQGLWQCELPQLRDVERMVA